jgi:nucleotide-binding universal stress UspA family protein
LRTPLGHPAALAILETARSEAADLIVMGTHGLGGFRKWLLGSTTERLLRRTDVPVLVVPPAGDDSAISRADGRLELSQVLAATDFSESSIAAVRTAVDLAAQFSARLVLVHVVEPLAVPPQWRPLPEDADETRVADARTRLEALADEYCGPLGYDVVVSVGRPADVISSLAQDRRAQLIVMGLNSDQGRFAARPGSIAYRVVSSATVPALVVPSTDK